MGFSSDKKKMDKTVCSLPLPRDMNTIVVSTTTTIVTPAEAGEEEEEEENSSTLELGISRESFFSTHQPYSYYQQHSLDSQGQYQRQSQQHQRQSRRRHVEKTNVGCCPRGWFQAFFETCGRAAIERQTRPKHSTHTNGKSTLETHIQHPKTLDPWLSLDSWAEEARDDIPSIRTFRFFLYYGHLGLAFYYLALSLFCFLFAGLVPFQNAAGTCMEQTFPLSVIIAIYNLVEFFEEASYLIWYGHYWHWLYRWQNPRRWIIRAVNGAFFSVFMSELGCALNLPTVIGTSVLYIGGITSFLHYQKEIGYEYACRSLKRFLFDQNDSRHHFIPKYKVSKYDLYVSWFRVFVPIFPSLFQLWWIYIDSGTLSDSNGVTWKIFIIYGFGLVQAIGIFLIPLLIHSKRKKAQTTELFSWFLMGEIATLALFAFCDGGISLAYILVTRYPN